MLERHVIKYLAPGWFAVVMGTGGLANILYQWKYVFPAGNMLSLAVAALADILFSWFSFHGLYGGSLFLSMFEGIFIIQLQAISLLQCP